MSWVLHLMPFLVAKFKHKHEYGELNAIWRKFSPGPTLSLGKQTWACWGGREEGICQSSGRESQRVLRVHRWLPHLLPLFILPKKLVGSEMCQRGTNSPTLPHSWHSRHRRDLGAWAGRGKVPVGATPVWFVHLFLQYVFLELLFKAFIRMILYLSIYVYLYTIK